MSRGNKKNRNVAELTLEQPQRASHEFFSTRRYLLKTEEQSPCNRIIKSKEFEKLNRSNFMTMDNKSKKYMVKTSNNN